MKKSFLPLRGLFVSYVFGASLIAVADVILVLVDLVRSKVAKRRRNRLWAPKGLRALANAVVFGRSGEQLAETLGEEDARDRKEKGDGIDEEDETYTQDPDSKPPQNGFQRVMHAFHGVYEWTGTAEFLFCFRYTLLSVVLYLPAVFPKSAEFYYAQKGLWALIMAQTTLNIYAGDQIYNYVIRLLGTLVGLIVGLLIWYIGNAKSNGNAYGSAASMAVFLVPLVFVRLYAPVQYLPGVIIMNATVVLIVGYSWIDGHLAVFDPPGIGWPIAWRRWVLVVIGSAASFIIMMLPPKSGRKVVRLRNASTINKLAQTYTFLMSAWIRTDMERTEQDQREGPLSEDRISEAQDPANEKQLDNTGGNSMRSEGLDARKFPNQWKEPFRQKMVSVISQLQGVLQQTEMARWEGNLRGHWPHKDYVRLAQVQLEMTACMSQLAGALWKMDDEWRVSLLHHTNVLNPNFIQDVLTTFSLVSQSLRTGEPIHTVLPQNILERLVYHYTPVYLSAINSGGGKNAGEGGNQTRGGIRQVDSSVFKSLNYMYYSAAVVAVFQILECVDELHSITRRLCGEVPFVGFHEWRGTHQRAHDPTAARSS